LVRKQSLPQLVIREILNGEIAIDGQRGSGRSALAKDHEDRLHTDAAEGDM
jgi:hypothetical protein